MPETKDQAPLPPVLSPDAAPEVVYVDVDEGEVPTTVEVPAREEIERVRDRFRSGRSEWLERIAIIGASDVEF